MNANIIEQILSRLNITETGKYDNHFYVIDLVDSDAYAKMYTKLNKNAINIEYPSFGTNSDDATVKITNYFELEESNQKYNLFLIADFTKNRYYLKIGGFN